MGMGVNALNREARWQWTLTAIAGIFFAVGMVGIGLVKSDTVAAATCWHLLLMGVLLTLSFRQQFMPFAKWAIIIGIAAFFAEWIGVHYGWMFGQYRYSGRLGWRFADVPVIIAVNWIVVVAGSISAVQLCSLPRWTIVLLSPLLATAHDFLLEPVAIAQGWWSWTGNVVPAYNYLCWYALSAVFSGVWLAFGVKGNIFAAALFIIQSIFFVLLQVL